ncbi:hypothetical protein WISP_06213 [Willisornis vidua]|uniref:Uncharacterized protein n=1 Tax=Willisornis vidua TaxID=1566151 RepID=A0ABQ9DX69_9PASS|nr:hypothetical protein WISP_06213 [Willisornis vidua]
MAMGPIPPIPPKVPLERGTEPSEHKSHYSGYKTLKRTQSPKEQTQVERKLRINVYFPVDNIAVKRMAAAFSQYYGHGQEREKLLLTILFVLEMMSEYGVEYHWPVEVSCQLA